MLESKLKELEGNLNTGNKIQSNNIFKKELDYIYDHIAGSIRIRSKYDRYEISEKSTKFSWLLRKKWSNQNQFWKLIFDEKEVDEDVKILNKIKAFKKHLLKVSHPKMYMELKNFYAPLLLHLLTSIRSILAKKTYVKLIYGMQLKTCQIINILEMMD